MKIILALSFFVTVSTAEFPGLGNIGGNIGNSFGNLSNNLGNDATNFANSLQSAPLLAGVKNYAEFLATTGKTYASAAEQTIRENIFNARQTLVEESNRAFQSGVKIYELAVNTFSDLTNSEFLTQLTGFRKSLLGEEKTKRHRQAPKIGNGPVPDTFNWREKGGVTKVKYQGTCGSCWSFAVTGAIEGHIFRKTGILPNLSEQNLIDCGKEDFGLNGCNGGFQEYGFEFVINQDGIAAAEEYPYIDKKDTCKYENGIKAAEITGFAVIPPKDEMAMKAIIATLGPLACSIRGIESLLLYKNGIYADEECNNAEPNHSVLVLGYGSEKGQDYWIVKNSWNETWGEDGFFRLLRGNNFCSIATECSYPII